jgi:serine/threonine-protein kinase ULK2
MVLEYCDGGDLDSFLNKHGRLPEATAKDLMRQLGMVLMLGPGFLMCSSASLCCFGCSSAEGLKVLRGRNIVHRDLKPQVC